MSETAVALRTLSLFQSLSLLLQEMALITFFFRIKQVLIEKKIASGGRATLPYQQLMFSHSGTGDAY